MYTWATTKAKIYGMDTFNTDRAGLQVLLEFVHGSVRETDVFEHSF